MLIYNLEDFNLHWFGTLKPSANSLPHIVSYPSDSFQGDSVASLKKQI